MSRALNNQSGAALIVTLAIVAILIAAGLQLSKFTGDSVMATLTQKEQFQADQLALSGINLASLILAEDALKDSTDSVQDAWADPEKLEQAVNELGLENETLVIQITDELSKIQVNALIKEFPGNQINPDQNRIWESFLQDRLSNLEEEEETQTIDPASIINALKDWLDSADDDAISGLSGAESGYYLGLDPPYECANSSFNHLDEVLNVKGMLKDLLTSEEDADYTALFTVYGLDIVKSDNGGYKYSGKININTAKEGVLAALLPQGMKDLAKDLVDFRAEKGEEGDVFVNLLDKGWYKKVIELSDKELKRFERTIQYASDTFKVESTAQKNNTTVRLVAYVKREQHEISGKWVCKTLQLERN
ncbi:MAG: general secretion pathway protein GspK [Desulfobacteraceae bacterium]|nr:general secretion pathway protein GspK [Desulfobacteraceae bacterium]